MWKVGDSMLWDSPEKLRALICELVSWDSETLTQGEQLFSAKLFSKLQQLAYFKYNPTDLKRWEVEYGRSVIAANYRNLSTKRTVVLLSHFDTVQIEEYADLKPLATQPELLTQKLLEKKGILNKNAQKDLLSGDYLFGRGVMDMKMGLALHLQLLEQAIEENWPINLLLVTVPDEEVNSAGMREAVKQINLLKQEEGLKIDLVLNSEPSFSKSPTDIQEYIYSGTIGKIMPAALFYGKETHVGEPLKGMTAPYISSFLTAEMEWNELFLEEDYGEYTPLPVSLQLKDLKGQYSTQTPYRAVAMYNVFLLKRSASEIMDIFEEVTHTAMAKCQQRYEDICKKNNVTGIAPIRVLRFEQLQIYIEQKIGVEKVEQLIDKVVQDKSLDDREKSLRIADSFMIHCQELAPATILLFVPPYYPPANSSEHPLVKNAIHMLLEEAKSFDIPLEQVHYFNGICDLSYCQFQTDENWKTYELNTPVWNRTYSIPFEEMASINAPVLNVGPFGKDAHQISERLHIKSAFEEMPVLLNKLIHFVIEEHEIKGSGAKLMQ
ncbi:M20/M25/M40 family metallo-hydrolase [Peribacillus butanolivorans]|uniref:M20/M25/M40 family metallo-hydrolase n=1 Tax=Peribacillus butanolivorans TaxID=421767 RepID=UPI003657C2EA